VIDLVPIPKQWPRMALGEICDIRGGFPAPQEDSAFEDGTIPFVRMKDVGRHHLTNDLHRTEQSLNREYFEKARFELTPRGSILMPRSGSVGLNHRAILTIDAVIVSHLCALVLTSKMVSGDFLYRFLCQVDMRRLTKKTTGLDSIAFSDLRQVAVPVPPLAEQQRITAVLDQAEALRIKRRVVLDEIDILSQAIFLDLFGDPIRNSRKWPQETLETFFHFRTGKLDSNAAVATGQYPFFTCSREDSRIDSFAFDCEALLLAGNNASADYSVKHYKGKFNAYQRTYVITLRNERNSYDYARFVLEHRLTELKRMSKGTNTKYLTMELLNRIRVPVPPEELQNEYSRRVAAVEKLRTTHLASLANLDALFAAIQHRAFGGEL
jgi:type I restriction enzyme S subunit